MRASTHKHCGNQATLFYFDDHFNLSKQPTPVPRSLGPIPAALLVGAQEMMG